MDSKENPFEDLAVDAEAHSAGAHNRLTAYQIRAEGRQYQQSDMLNQKLEALKWQIGKLEQSVNALKSTIDRFNSDSSKLYSTLSWLTFAIAAATVAIVFLALWQFN